MKKENIHTLNQIIVIINGKIPNNPLLRKNLDNLVILWNNKEYSYLINQFLDNMRKDYFLNKSEVESEYLERIEANLPNLITNEHKIKKTIKHKKTKKQIDLNELEVKPKNKNPLNDNILKLRKRLNNNNQIQQPKKTKITSKRELNYSDIKPYLSKRQLSLLKETTMKNNITYETCLLTTNQEYFNKKLDKAKRNYLTKYLGNKHINSKIGIIYRLFQEKV